MRQKGYDFLIFTVELSVTALRFADLLRPYLVNHFAY